MTSTVAAVWSRWPWLSMMESTSVRSSFNVFMLCSSAFLLMPVSKTIFVFLSLASTVSMRKDRPH